MYKEYQKKVNNLTPEIYAAIAIALHTKCGWGYKRINDLFQLSEKIWDECIEQEVDMITKCENEIGIVLKGEH